MRAHPERIGFVFDHFLSDLQKRQIVSGTRSHRSYARVDSNAESAGSNDGVHLWTQRNVG
jgi:hypothetical protein